jgi:endo-1,3-1,4-beta-glycanase ExoK
MKHDRHSLGAAIAVAICFATATASVAQDKPEEPASFHETFDRLSPARWYTSNGWTNGAHQNCTWSSKNLRITDGVLELSLTKNPQGMSPPEKASEARDYSCAEVRTNNAYGYGTYEVRMNAAAAPGLVSAFFTYVGPYPDPDKPHDEIDFEFLGKDARQVQLNYYASAEGKHEKMIDLGFDASKEMADYAFEWREDAIRWFINGRLVHEAKAEAGKPFPSTPSSIILSIWGSDNLDAWLEKFAYPGKPLVARYDWVAFTRPGEECKFPESILCKHQKRSDASGGAGPVQR